MKSLIPALVFVISLLPGISSAQTVPLEMLLKDEGRQFCLKSWNGSGGANQRLYQACLLEQRQAKSRIQSIHSRFSSQGFYRDIALPHCRSVQGSGLTPNLVEISFCLEDELAGYQVIQDLRSRYGGSRIDRETGKAIAAAGSWAAAANRVKRNAGLKTIR